METVPGLAGGLVVAFCNTRFLAVAPRLRGLGCRVIWLGCMNWLFPRDGYSTSVAGRFDRHVFQSHYQHDESLPQFASLRLSRRTKAASSAARSAPDEFTFAAASARGGSTVHVGRISRADPDKFSRNLWQVFAPDAASRCTCGCWAGTRHRSAGWGLRRRGPSALPAGAQPARAVPSRLARAGAIGETAVENWPRVGLEAMAAGVPLVVDANGGWRK